MSKINRLKECSIDKILDMVAICPEELNQTELNFISTTFKNIEKEIQGSKGFIEFLESEMAKKEIKYLKKELFLKNQMNQKLMEAMPSINFWNELDQVFENLPQIIKGEADELARKMTLSAIKLRNEAESCGINIYETPTYAAKSRQHHKPKQRKNPFVDQKMWLELYHNIEHKGILTEMEKTYFRLICKYPKSGGIGANKEPTKHQKLAIENIAKETGSKPATVRKNIKQTLNKLSSYNHEQTLNERLSRKK